MSLSLLESVRDHISDAGLLSGYDVRMWTWNDSLESGNNPIMLFRISGSGESSIVIQRTHVDIVMIDNPANVVTGDERMTEILRLFRANDRRAGILRFLPLGTKRGPFKLENGRNVWELTIEVTTEDQ